MKLDERQYRDALKALHGGPYGFGWGVPTADEVAVTIGMHPKRALRILEKWEDRGEWDCGTSTRCGWFTPEGFSK